MESINLLSICAIAFAAVFLILIVLAVLMRLIISLFPQRTDHADQNLIAAVSTVAAHVYPGTIITKIEEIR